MKVICVKCGIEHDCQFREGPRFMLRDAFIQGKVIYAECEHCIERREEQMDGLKDEIAGSLGD